MVLTGKNGSGKTRFLQAVSNGAVSVLKDDRAVLIDSLRFVEQNGLVAQFGFEYDENSRRAKLQSLLGMFKTRSRELDIPLNPQDPTLYTVAGRHGGLSWAEAHGAYKILAKRLGKKPSELTVGEISSLYDENYGLFLGGYAVGAMFNGYMKRREENLYNRFLKTQLGRESVYYVLDEEFEERFGAPPWVGLNKILHDAFDGKFKFFEPGDEYDPSFRTFLCLSESGESIDPNDLSSGEKTLLWLVFAMFGSSCELADCSNFPALLLVDEPDAFLHPSMVAKMLQCFEGFSDVFDTNVIITTHSPTTVALASSDSIFMVEYDKVVLVDQDQAISELLDGVTKISINPYNRRQVYVESSNDVELYQMLYGAALRYTEMLDKKISLSFISAGMKYPSKLVSEKLKEFFGELDDALIEKYTSAVNGVGSCSAVRGTVEYLRNAGSDTVRGLIDRDKKNESDELVHVLGGGSCYAIDNLVFDPVCTLLLAHYLESTRLPMVDICGEDVSFDEWLENDALLQESVDRYMCVILGRKNREDFVIEYVGGKSVRVDKEYLEHQGHSLWRDKIEKKYSWLLSIGKTEEGVKRKIVEMIMLTHTKGKFIPLLFIDAFAGLQKG